MPMRLLMALAAILLAGLPAVSQAGGKQVAPVADPLTQKVCGECHLAFPPGFLPARSWSALMADLSDHFGEEIVLPAGQAAQIEAYLVSHAGDAPGGGGLREFMRWVAPTGIPRRITENPAFLREHDFPDRVWRDPKVVTRSNCLACHPGASRGWFDD
ncbi:cytochrome C [Ferrovibrio sp.]|uniref:cytochrome C n=1 Tax=Ferrovibrio sp. TaxID=1917215 RepID=UPI00260332DD|nr:cytochrome C [Ferrovibrio sp.]